MAPVDGGDYSRRTSRPHGRITRTMLIVLLGCVSIIRTAESDIHSNDALVPSTKSTLCSNSLMSSSLYKPCLLELKTKLRFWNVVFEEGGRAYTWNSKGAIASRCPRIWIEISNGQFQSMNLLRANWGQLPSYSFPVFQSVAGATSAF